MVNQVTSSTSLVYNQKTTQPEEGRFNGKKLINIDSSYLQKKNFGAGNTDKGTMVLIIAGLILSAAGALFGGIALGAYIKGITFAAALGNFKAAFNAQALITIIVVIIARVGASFAFPATK